MVRWRVRQHHAEKLALGKRMGPASDAAVHDFLKLAREATNKADDIENAVYDLKAVNPNKAPDVERRTPSELLDLAEAKGLEIAEVLKALTS